MLYNIIILVIALLGFFVEFQFLGQTGNIIFKVLLFFTLGYIIYRQNYPDGFQNSPEDKNFPEESDFENEPPEAEKLQYELTDGDVLGLLKDPDLALNSFLASQFEVLFNYFVPNNGYLFIEYHKEDIRLLYKRIKSSINWRDSQDVPNIIKLLSNHDSEILIENNLNDKSTVIPYYESTTYFPSSVFAMATIVAPEQRLFWVFDAPSNGFFNEEELMLANQVSFSTQYVISNLLAKQLNDKKLSIEQKNNELNFKLNSADKKDTVTNIFIEFLADFFEAHKLTIAMLDEKDENMASIIKSVGQLDSQKPGTRFNLKDGLCGKVIATSKTYLIDDIEKDGYFIPRFTANEKTNFGLRCFLATPLIVNNKTIGMISLENKEAGKFSKKDKTLLVEYVRYLSNALLRFENKKKGE